MTQHRHIGGSLLPSSDPQILQPKETPFGVLQVKAHADLDTHILWLKHGDGGCYNSMLAEHANGYSLNRLAECMIDGHADKIIGQASYIASCGGMIRSVQHLVNIANPEDEQDGDVGQSDTASDGAGGDRDRAVRPRPARN